MRKISDPLILLLSTVGLGSLFIFVLALLCFGIGYGIWYAITFQDLSNIPFMTVHSVWYILGLLMFPRITLLIHWYFYNLATAGVFWWIAWFVAPRFLIAGMATAYYWDTNPVLVVFAWLAALGGGSSSSESSRRSK